MGRPATAVLLTAALSACTSMPIGDPGAPIGFARSGSQNVIAVQLCASQELTALTVSTVRGGPIGGETGDPVWKIVSDGSRTVEYTIGETPAGWKETLPLARPLPRLFAVDIEYRGGTTLTDLTYSDERIPRGHVSYQGRLPTRENFFGKLRNDRC